MKKTKIYLAGRVGGLDDGGKTWRAKVEEILKTVECDYVVFNPTKYFSYEEEKHKTQKQIKDYYFSQLINCDVVLLNCSDTDCSIGTAQEVQFAVDHGIPVIGFGNKNTYPWIVECDCQVVFGSVLEAIDYIVEYYMLGGV